MDSSSNLLPLLVSLSLLLLLVPYIHCDLQNYKVVNKYYKTKPTETDKMLSDLVNLAPKNNGYAYIKHEPSVYGLAWCRGDFSRQKCYTCLANASDTLIKSYTHETTVEGIVYEDFCYLHIDNLDFLPNVDWNFVRMLRNNTTDQQIVGEHQAAYNNTVAGLLLELKQVTPQLKNKFVEKKVDFDAGKLVIYGMGQCAQGITKELCEFCLGKTMDIMMPRCMFSKRCQLFMGGICVLEYDAKITTAI